MNLRIVSHQISYIKFRLKQLFIRRNKYEGAAPGIIFFLRTSKSSISEIIIDVHIFEWTHHYYEAHIHNFNFDLRTSKLVPLEFFIYVSSNSSFDGGLGII